MFTWQITLCVVVAVTTQLLLPVSGGHGRVSTQVTSTTPARLCPAMLSSEEVLVKECRTEDVVVSCAQPMRVGTTVELTCGEGLISSSNSKTWSRTCELNGEWTKQQTTCRPLSEDCGSRVVKEVSVSGQTVTSEQPWLIAIYWRLSPTSTDWDYANVMGTLISTTHVVSSAWGVSLDKSSAVPASQLRLVAGKHLPDPDIAEPDTQWRNASSLILHEQVHYESSAHDIALLVAGEPFTVSWNVNIACVDWSGLLQAPTPGQRVLTAGERYGVNASSLVFASQPAVIVSLEECHTLSSEDERRHLSADDLCTRTTSNSTCYDINGGALLVERTTSRGARFFLVGVKRYKVAYSYARGCFYNILSSYTSVSTHASWIRRHIDLSA